MKAILDNTDWKGKIYQGSHAPLVSKELWGIVQEILTRRFDKKSRKVKHDFAFSGIMTCGHCGCSLVGELKKGKYVYYHCTGFKQKCPEPYVREEVLAERFAKELDRLVFDVEVLEWVREALRESHKDAKKHHDEAIARLQAEYSRIQTRIDAMYLDKLDGRITADFFDRKSAEWRQHQDEIQEAITEHRVANQQYLDQGVMLLELAHRSGDLFRKQSPAEKRPLLNFVLSNSTWKDGTLEVEFRQPFDMIAETATAWEKEKAAGRESGDICLNWLPGLDSNQQPFG